MDLNQFIALFGPAAFATIIHMKKCEIKDIPLALIFLCYAAAVNALNYLVMYFIFRQPDLLFNIYFSAKYIALGLIDSVIVVSLVNVCIKNKIIDIQILKKAKKNEKK